MLRPRKTVLIEDLYMVVCPAASRFQRASGALGAPQRRRGGHFGSRTGARSERQRATHPRHLTVHPPPRSA